MRTKIINLIRAVQPGLFLYMELEITWITSSHDLVITVDKGSCRALVSRNEGAPRPFQGKCLRYEYGIPSRIFKHLIEYYDTIMKKEMH